MASCPRTIPLYRRHGSLGDHIRDAQRAGHRWPQPIGRLVINMIREPEFWPKFGKLLAVAKKTIGDPRSEGGQSALSAGLATPVITAKARYEDRLMSGKAYRSEEQLRNLTITRRHRMIGGLQRRIERDAHAPRTTAR